MTRSLTARRSRQDGFRSQAGMNHVGAVREPPLHTPMLCQSNPFLDACPRIKCGASVTGMTERLATALPLLLLASAQGIPHQLRQTLPVHPGAEASLAAFILPPLSLCAIPFLCHDALLPPATREGRVFWPAPRNTVFRILWPPSRLLARGTPPGALA